MKNLVILTAIMFTTLVNGQTFVYLEPGHLQFGAGYHQQLTPMFGSYGKIRTGNIEHDSFYADEIKPAAGISFNPWANMRSTEVKKNAAFLIGINYSHFYNVKDDNMAIDLNRIHKLSVDFGFLVHVEKTKIFLYATSDIPNWETEIGFGYKF